MEYTELMPYKRQTISSKQQIAAYLKQVKDPNARYLVQCQMNEVLLSDWDKNGKLFAYLYKQTLKDVS